MEYKNVVRIATDLKEEQEEFLECEKWWIFAVLMFVGGFYGAYTYTARGGIFCNAQTANLVMMAMALGSKNFGKAAYYLVPLTAYLAGTMLSEAWALSIKKFHFIRWDTMLILIEIIVVIILGFVPDSAPYQIAQISINFLCSMQYNTFRQAYKIPMATTFCTNHVRQIGVALTKAIRNHGEQKYVKRMNTHIAMIIMFVLGGTVATILVNFFTGRAIWAAVIPLTVIFVDLLHADLTIEKDKLHKKPSGH